MSEMRKWIDAGKQVAKDRNAKVPCPNCGFEYLEVKEVLNPSGDKVDIHLQCPSCGKRNVITVIS